MRSAEDGLRLTEDEALGLLDIVLLSPMELSSEQRTAIVKLSEFCRQFLRENTEATPAYSLAQQASALAASICAA